MKPTLLLLALSICLSVKGQTNMKGVKGFSRECPATKPIRFGVVDSLIDGERGTVLVIKLKNGKFKRIHLKDSQSFTVEYIKVFIQNMD